MAEHHQNVEIFRGESRTIDIAIQDAAGAPFDLTGKAVHYRIAVGPGAAPLLSIDRPVLTTAAAVASVPLAAAQTKALPPRVLYHELYLDDAGKISVLMTGSLNVQLAQASQHGAA